MNHNFEYAVVAHPAIGIAAKGRIEKVETQGDWVYIQFADPNIGRVCAHQHNVILSEKELRD